MLGLPAVLYVLAFGVWPILQGLYYAFFDYSLIRPRGMRFVGLRNFTDLFEDSSTRRAILNTFVFTAGAVVVEFLAGLGLALLLWPDTRFNRACLALLLVPVTVTPLAVGLLWGALLAPDVGPVGYWLAALGVSDARGLLADPRTALAALIAVDVWQWTPLVALILLAGLKALPQEVLEAAVVDGARPFAAFRHVMLPLLLPVMALALIMRGMDAFKIFDSVLATTGGGPDDATNVLMYHAVKQGLEFFEIGSAAAVSAFMLACIGVMAAGFVLLLRRLERGAA